MLEVRGLVAGYGEFAVLHEVDLDLATGESAAIMGANGAGKSTLMKAISKSIPVMAGSVRWKGDELTQRSADAVAHSRVAYVPQEANVFAENTPSASMRTTKRLRSCSSEPTSLPKSARCFS